MGKPIEKWSTIWDNSSHIFTHIHLQAWLISYKTLSTTWEYVNRSRMPETVIYVLVYKVLFWRDFLSGCSNWFSWPTRGNGTSCEHNIWHYHLIKNSLGTLATLAFVCCCASVHLMNASPPFTHSRLRENTSLHQDIFYYRWDTVIYLKLFSHPIVE